MTRSCLILALLPLLTGGGAVCQDPPAEPAIASDSTSAVRWPIPPGWSHESFTLPPEFALTFPYSGTEELRFMPGFYQPSAPDYWSYDLVWWMNQPPAFDAATVSAALTTYFRGLATAVGQKKYHFDSTRFRSTLAGAAGGTRLSGQVFSYDPFTTGAAIVLNVEVTLRKCPAAQHTAILVALSPGDTSAGVWTQLRAAATAFACR